MHYDPYGLNLAGLSQSSPGLRPLNKFTFNGVEFGDELGLGLHLTLFRLYDPQLGRFHQVDPLADFTPDCSPFAFADGNPVANSDPDGLAADGPGPLLKLWRAVKETALAAAGFTKHGDYNARGRGGQGNVYHTFLGRTHHSQGGNQGIKPLKPNMATLDVPPLGGPAVPCMDFVAIAALPPVVSPPAIKRPPPHDMIFGRKRVISGVNSFHERIVSINNEIKLDEPSVKNAQHLAKFLKDNPSTTVIIIGQAGSPTYDATFRYSNIDPPGEVMGQMFSLHGKNIPARNYLLMRAQAVADILIKNGIKPSRITTRAGGFYNNKKDNVPANIKIIRP